jgi:predicted NUDIX family phosphoesterase
MSSEIEQVLVVERRLLDQCGSFQGLALDIDRYLPVLMDDRNHRFVPRPAAESDPSLKQLIPYFIIVCNGRIWTYTRGKSSGESRLVAKVSFGIGGHINSQDVGADGGEGSYTRAAARELAEEVVLPAGCTQSIVALLNDDATPVGTVHLGVVHVLVTPTEDVRPNELAIAEAGFKSIEELRPLRDRMETWSQICFDAIDELFRRGKVV